MNTTNTLFSNRITRRQYLTYGFFLLAFGLVFATVAVGLLIPDASVSEFSPVDFDGKFDSAIFIMFGSLATLFFAART